MKRVCCGLGVGIIFTITILYLEKVIADIESGKAKLVEHDLIEE